MRDGVAHRSRRLPGVQSSEDPRERLLRHGAATLSDAELLAVLLGTWARGEAALDVPRRLLCLLGGIPGVARADGLVLESFPGLGPSRAATLLAALEAARRAAESGPDRAVLSTPEAVVALAGPRLRSRATELLLVLSLDARGALLREPRPIEGGTRSVAARPADVLREPVVLRATSVVLVHNHPSGDPTPSPQDIALTRVLVEAGRLLDLEVLDHVIVGSPAFLSLRREGLGFPRDLRASAS